MLTWAAHTAVHKQMKPKHASVRLMPRAATDGDRHAIEAHVHFASSLNSLQQLLEMSEPDAG